MPYADPEKRRTYLRDYHARNRERQNAARAKYRQDNYDAERENWQEYAKRRSAQAVANVRAWRARNPERNRLQRQRDDVKRRAREADAFVEHVEPLVVLERDDGVCGLCGGDVDPLDFQVDHIIPLARGGEHSYANCQTAHGPCNNRKNARLELVA